MRDLVFSLAPQFLPPTSLVIGTRVRLRDVPGDDIPDGALGTVVDVYRADDDVVVVVPDLRPSCRLLYAWPEFLQEAVVLAALSRSA
jgi:hypothetical protein